MVKLVLDEGAKVDAVMQDGSNALFRVFLPDNWDVTISRLKDLKPWNRTRNWWREQQEILDERHREVVKLLVKHGMPHMMLT